MIVNNTLVPLSRHGRVLRPTLVATEPEVRVVEPVEIIPPIDPAAASGAGVSRGFAPSGRGPGGRARGLFLDILV